MNDFIIGTANFGKKYGVVDSPKLEIKEVFKILHIASERGINLLDTSIAYGNSEFMIGQFHKNNFNKKFKVITKTPVNLSSYDSPNVFIKKFFDSALKRLNIDQIETILIHNIDDFFRGKKEEIIDTLNQIKETGKVNKIGISIYNKMQFQEIIKYFIPEVVQLPLSILDQRVIENGVINEIKSLGCEIHSRSIFLQGLLLCKYEQIPKKLKLILKKIKQLEELSKELGYSKLQLGLNFINSIDNIDFKIVGINSTNHLNQILYDYRMHISSLNAKELVKIQC